MKGDVQKWSGRLTEQVEAYRPGLVNEPLDRIREAAEHLEAGQTVGQKKIIRDSLWEMRQKLAAAGETPAEVKASYEKLRGLSLDNSWERQLNGFPSGTYNIDPKAEDLPNFQVVNENMLRGGQPGPEGMDWLLQYGVKTEIDLRGDDRDNQWNPPAWGPKNVFTINVKDFGNPEFSQVERFLELADNPENQPVFYHCKAGIGRTGIMTACWRVAHGATADEALRFENINSYAGTLKQEQFVREFEQYWRRQHFTTAA